MTANGKQTTAHLRCGDRPLITDDRSKASAIRGWRLAPARVKTDVKTATVTGVKTNPDGRRTRYDVSTGIGAVMSVTSAQTFLPAPEDPPTPTLTSPVAGRVQLQGVATPERRAHAVLCLPHDIGIPRRRGLHTGLADLFLRRPGRSQLGRLALGNGADARRDQTPCPGLHPDYPAAAHSTAPAADLSGRLRAGCGRCP